MGVDYKDYYKILGVSKTATKDDISKAYKKLARKYHPDLNQGDKDAEERFKEVNEAHEVLKDPEKRKMYDQLGPNWQNGQNFQRPPGFENMHFSFGGNTGQSFGGSGFSDFFETLFGGGGFSQARGAGAQDFGGFGYNAPQKGRDIEATLKLSLEDAYKGGKRKITVGGRSLEVNIPAGIKQGAKIRLSGQGDNGTQGGANGDLYLIVNILPSKDFALEGVDVTYELALAPWEAALGCSVRVPTLDGAVDLKIAPGTSGGKKFRLKGKGLGTGHSKGDQFVKTNIVLPEKMADEEKKLWEKLSQISTFAPRA